MKSSDNNQEKALPLDYQKIFMEYFKVRLLDGSFKKGRYSGNVYERACKIQHDINKNRDTKKDEKMV